MGWKAAIPSTMYRASRLLASPKNEGYGRTGLETIRAMTTDNQSRPSDTQLDKLKQAAKQIEGDEACCNEKLAKIAKVKPEPEKPDA